MFEKPNFKECPKCHYPCGRFCLIWDVTKDQPEWWCAVCFEDEVRWFTHEINLRIQDHGKSNRPRSKDVGGDHAL